MADATVATGSELKDIWGKHRVYGCTLTDPADTNTVTAKGLSRILNVQITFKDADSVAAEHVAVASVSGNIITLQVAGTTTQTTCYLLAIGV